MKTYVSLGVFVVVMASVIPLVAWANSKENQRERENLETQNLLAVAEGNRLCEEAACIKDHLTCGLFEYWDSPYGKKVLYKPSLCELNYQNSKAREEEKKVDQEIRKKYANN